MVLFFSVMPIGPNPAQIFIPVPLKSPTAGLLYKDFDANYRLPPERIFVKTHLCAESRQVSHSRVQHHNHQMTKSKSTCSLGTSTVSASAQQNTAQWDKFVDFNNRFLNGFPKVFDHILKNWKTAKIANS